MGSSGVWVCTKCGSLVARKYTEEHIKFHGGYLSLVEAIKRIVGRFFPGEDFVTSVRTELDFELLEDRWRK